MRMKQPALLLQLKLRLTLRLTLLMMQSDLPETCVPAGGPLGAINKTGGI
jgi:hypothetical protein